MDGLSYSKRERIRNCTYVKTLLMICVILGHCVNFWNGKWFTAVAPVESAYPLVVISSFVNSFHVYAFTLVSGYLFCFLKVDLGKYQRFGSFIKNKSKRLLVPYIVVCLLYVAPIARYFNHYQLKEIIVRYVIGTNPNQLWFLLMLFWVFAISWPLSKCFQKHFVLSNIYVILFYMLGMVGSRFVPNIYFVWTGCEYLLSFWIGFQLYNHEEYFSRIAWWIWCMLFVIVFTITEIISLPSIILSVIEIILHVFGAIAAFECLQWLATKIDWKNSGVFMFLSKRSMPVYLFHQQVIYFTIIWLNGKINPYIHVAINFVVAMTVSLIISSILMKFKITRFLIGEK